MSTAYFSNIDPTENVKDLSFSRPATKMVEAAKRMAEGWIGLVKVEAKEMFDKAQNRIVAYTVAGFLLVVAWMWLCVAALSALTRIMTTPYAALIIVGVHLIFAFSAVYFARRHNAVASTSAELDYRVDLRVGRNDLKNAAEELKSKAVQAVNPAAVISRHALPVLLGSFLLGAILGREKHYRNF